MSDSLARLNATPKSRYAIGRESGEGGMTKVAKDEWSRRSGESRSRSSAGSSWLPALVWVVLTVACTQDKDHPLPPEAPRWPVMERVSVTCRYWIFVAHL